MSDRIPGHLRGFVGKDGTVDQYAVLCHNRVLADLFYLHRFRTLGREEAGRQTCSHYGHDGKGRCVRCGVGIAARRAEHLAERGG